MRLVVGATSSGPADFLARVFSEAVGPSVDRTFVVENRPGASGTLAAALVAKAPRDGHTLLVAGPASMIVAPLVYPFLSYDPRRDFVPVVMLGAGPLVLVVRSTLPVRAVHDLIERARTTLEPLSVASAGKGSTTDLCAEAFLTATNLRMTKIPYKGDAQAANDLSGGHVDVAFTAPNIALQHQRSGKLRVLAITSMQRLASLPWIPTLHESGLPNFQYLGWLVLYAPAGVPVALMNEIGNTWNRARLQSPVKDDLEQAAMQPLDSIATGPGLKDFLELEHARLSNLVRLTGLQAER